MSSPQPRIVFFGTPEFAAHILRALVDAAKNVVAVVTIPAKPQGRGRGLKASAVEQEAHIHDIPILAPERLRDETFIASLHALNAEIFCVVAFKILPREVYSIPRLGSFNIHASLLPKFRGAAPINWAIMRGEEETGITTFMLADKVDTGSMLLQRSISIGENETAGELHDRLMSLGATVAIETIDGIWTHSIAPQPQNGELASTAPKIFPADCVVNPMLPRMSVHNFIRGLSPYPAATIEVKGLRLKLLRSQISLDGPTLVEPGTFAVTEHGTRLFFGTATGPLELLQLQREGKAAMDAATFLRGARELFSR